MSHDGRSSCESVKSRSVSLSPRYDRWRDHALVRPRVLSVTERLPGVTLIRPSVIALRATNVLRHRVPFEGVRGALE